MSFFFIFLFFLLSPLSLSSLVFSLSGSFCSSWVHGLSSSPYRSETSKPKHHWTQNPLRLRSAATNIEVEFDSGVIWFCGSGFIGLGSVVWFQRDDLICDLVGSWASDQRGHRPWGAIGVDHQLRVQRGSSSWSAWVFDQRGGRWNCGLVVIVIGVGLGCGFVIWNCDWRGFGLWVVVTVAVVVAVVAPAGGFIFYFCFRWWWLATTSHGCGCVSLQRKWWVFRERQRHKYEERERREKETYKEKK